MRSYVIGNSLVRGVDSSRWTTICLPGADWKEMLEYVSDNLGFLSNSYIYLHVGPVRFTHLHRTQNRREVALISRPVNIHAVFEPFRARLEHHNITPIVCPIYPIDFKRYNDHIAADSRQRGLDRRQILTSFYDEWSLRSQQMAEEENRDIIAFNRSHDMCTPFLHRQIFTRRRGRYAFRSHKLTDGLHPTPSIREEWVRELRRITSLNRAKHRPK